MYFIDGNGKGYSTKGAAIDAAQNRANAEGRDVYLWRGMRLIMVIPCAADIARAEDEAIR